MTNNAEMNPGNQAAWTLGGRRMRGALVLSMGCLAIVTPFVAGPLAVSLVGVLLIVWSQTVGDWGMSRDMLNCLLKYNSACPQSPTKGPATGHDPREPGVPKQWLGIRRHDSSARQTWRLGLRRGCPGWGDTQGH